MKKPNPLSTEDRRLINEQGAAINLVKHKRLVAKLMYEPVEAHLRGNLIIGYTQLFSEDDKTFRNGDGLEVSIAKSFPTIGCTTAACPQSYDSAFRDLQRPLVDLKGLLEYMNWAVSQGITRSLKDLDANSFFLVLFSPTVSGHNRALFPFASTQDHSLYLDNSSLWNYTITPYKII